MKKESLEFSYYGPNDHCGPWRPKRRPFTVAIVEAARNYIPRWNGGTVERGERFVRTVGHARTVHGNGPQIATTCIVFSSLLSITPFNFIMSYLFPRMDVDLIDIIIYHRRLLCIVLIGVSTLNARAFILKRIYFKALLIRRDLRNLLTKK